MGTQSKPINLEKLEQRVQVGTDIAPQNWNDEPPGENVLVEAGALMPIKRGEYQGTINSVFEVNYYARFGHYNTK